MRVIDGDMQIDCDEEVGIAVSRMVDKFRGLWRSCELVEYGDDCKIKWYVTFVFKNEYVETPACETMYEAMNFALRKVAVEKCLINQS